MLNKKKNNLIVGIDIRNIGKKRTGDEVVFAELISNFQFSISKQFSNFNDVKFKFLLFTDIENEDVLKEIEKRLGIVERDDFEIVSLIGGKFIWNFWTLPNYLRKNPVDIYHTQYITPFFVSRKIKIVTHIHDVSFKVYKQFIKWSDLFFLNILIPLSIRRADKIIAVSVFTKNEIEKYYPQARGKVEVVYNAVSNAIISETCKKTGSRVAKNSIPSVATDRRISNSRDDNTDKNQDTLRASYNLPEKYILYLGTLQPRKNIPALIKAYLKIAKKIPDIKLVVAGNSKAYNVDKNILNFRDDIVSKTQADIYFPGFIDEKDKMTLLANATAFIYPSFYEGFGIPPLEAMSVKVPTVVSDIPPHREIAENASIYFNPQSIDELAKKIYTICTDEKLRLELISLGQTRFKFFSWQKSAKKMLKIYRKIYLK